MPRRLDAKEFRWTCPPSWIPKAKKSDSATSPFIGQQRALDALKMGLAIEAPGYHVFVAGLEGGEKFDDLRPLLDRVRLSCPLLRDHVYVHNFEDPIRPQHIALEPGRGTALATAMGDWREALTRDIPRALRAEEHQNAREKLIRHYSKAEGQLFKRLSKRAEAAGLALVTIEDENGTRPDIMLKVGDQVVPMDDLSGLPAKERPAAAKLRRLELARAGLLDQLTKSRRKAHLMGLRLARELRRVDEGRVRDLVEGLTIALAEELEADEELGGWLGDAAGFALNNLHLFHRGPGMEDEDEAPIGIEVFEVNVVRAAKQGDCPVVLESHPNYSNLFGAVERGRLRQGPGHFHLAVRAGSLLAAEGGILVMDARDVISEAEVWRALKRTLQNHQLHIHALESLSPLGVTGVRPEPAPLDLKVVLVGDNHLFDTLHDSDPDFQEIFKVKAEFEDDLILEKSTVRQMVQALRAFRAEESLLPFADSGLCALIEEAVESAGARMRISVRLPHAYDTAREASYWARQAGKRQIDRTSVQEAVRQYRRQHDSETDWHQRAVLEGIYEIDTQGTRVGTLNALTVVSLGPLASGRVARISASVSAGDDTTLNIEREVDLSGPIHTKGVLILETFLRARLGQVRTLPFRAALTFDQSYGPIDGDSASSTEAYAMLSAIAKLPLRQDLAVTGALSMRGDVLAVGGVNDKIKGFFGLCQARGLTGTQGVLIPRANIHDLMLEGDLLAACKAGKFHIYAVDRIEQGLSILTGMSAGRPSKAGTYPKDTVFGKVVAALKQFEKNQKSDSKGT